MKSTRVRARKGDGGSTQSGTAAVLAQLHQEQAMLAAIMDATDVMLAYLDRDFNFLRVNPAYAASCSRRPEELLGQNHFTLFPHPENEVIFCRVRDTGEPVFYKDKPFEFPDQPERGVTYWDWSLAPVKEEGAVRGLVFSLRETTTYKRAELALAESEERFRAMAENSADVIFQMDTGNLVTYASPALHSFGYSSAQVVGEPFSKFIPPAELPRALEALRKINSGASISLFGLKLLRGDGTVADCEINATPILRDGRVIGVQGVVRDISERKRTEIKLQRLNHVLKALGNSRRAILLARNEAEYLDEVCRIVVEDCGFRMVWIGYAEEDAERKVRPVAQAGLGSDYLESVRITWDDSELGRGPTGTAIRTGRMAMCRNMLTDPVFAPWRAQALKRGYASSLVLPLSLGGKVFGALTIYAPEPDGFAESEVELLAELAEELAYGVVALREKTAREEAEAALRRNEAQLRTIFNSITEGLVVADLSGRLIYWNPAAVNIHGFTKIEEGQRHLEELVDTFELTDRAGEVVPVAEWPLPRILRGETLHGLELRVRRLDGARQGVFSYSGTLARDRQERPLLAIVVVRDITERKQAEMKIRGLNAELQESVALLEEVNQELERSNNDLQQFAYIVSHDLQAPLHTVASFLQLLERRYGDKLDLKGHSYFNYALDGATRMQQLLVDLLGFSRVGGGKLKLQPVDLGELVGRVVFNLQKAIVDCGGEVVIDSSLPVIVADDSQMLHLLQNLIANGLKFHGADPPRIEVFSKDCRNELVLCVRDNGIGIDPRFSEQVFLIFQRLHQRDEYGGTGIGLAICKKIVERHGGRIWVESELGQGATFCISLPMRREEHVA